MLRRRRNTYVYNIPLATVPDLPVSAAIAAKTTKGRPVTVSFTRRSFLRGPLYVVRICISTVLDVSKPDHHSETADAVAFERNNWCIGNSLATVTSKQSSSALVWLQNTMYRRLANCHHNFLGSTEVITVAIQHTKCVYCRTRGGMGLYNITRVYLHTELQQCDCRW